MSRIPFLTLLLSALFFSSNVLADGHDATKDMVDKSKHDMMKKGDDAKLHMMDKSDDAKGKMDAEMKHDEKAVDKMIDKGEHDAKQLKDKIEKDI